MGSGGFGLSVLGHESAWVHAIWDWGVEAPGPKKKRKVRIASDRLGWVPVGSEIVVLAGSPDSDWFAPMWNLLAWQPDWVRGFSDSFGLAPKALPQSSQSGTDEP